MAAVPGSHPLPPANVPLLPPWRQPAGATYLSVALDPRMRRPITQPAQVEGDTARAPVAPAPSEERVPGTPVPSDQRGDIPIPLTTTLPAAYEDEQIPGAFERLLEHIVVRGSIVLRDEYERVATIAIFVEEHPEVQHALAFPTDAFNYYVSAKSAPLYHLAHSPVLGEQAI
jgi:hypothetical protein